MLPNDGGYRNAKSNLLGPLGIAVVSVHFRRVLVRERKGRCIEFCRYTCRRFRRSARRTTQYRNDDNRCRQQPDERDAGSRG